MSTTPVPILSSQPEAEFPQNGDVKRAAARGGLALAARQGITLVASLLSGVFLARLLSPGEFGALALLLLVVNLGKVLVDLGLSASLIQSSTQPTPQERSAVFGLECMIAVALTGATVALADPLCDLANAAPGTAGALRIASLSLLTVPITSIVGYALERRLDFQRQGALLAVQPVLFALISVVLAAAGLGVAALGLALVLSNLGTMVLALSMRRPLPRPTLRVGPALTHVRFGIPYMGVTVVSSVKDSVIPLLIGALIGAAAVGYVSWAQQVATVGAYALFVLSRLLLPLFARLADDPERLAAAVSRTLFAANLVVAPVSAAIAVFAPDIVDVLYGRQWAVAIPLVYLLMAGNLVAPTSTVLLALMSAIGRPRISLVFAFIWLVTTWSFVSLLTPSQGFIGYGLANVLVQVCSLGLVWAARRHVAFRWLRALTLPWLLAVVAFAIPAVLDRLLVPTPSIFSLMALGTLGVLLFAGASLLAARADTMYLVKMFRRG